MSISGIQVISILEEIAKVIEEKKSYLTELDAVIGDGDHGLNMSKGFRAVGQKLRECTGEDVGEILKKTGMALVSNVGGAAGPLYGTAFMKAGMSLTGKAEVDMEDFINLLEAALDGMKMRGKAVRGEKTMVDALEPALDAMKKAKGQGQSPVEILRTGRDAALEGLEYTKTIAATKGRASYLGERSIGHQDAGATSSYFMLNTVYEAVKNITEEVRDKW
jgi:dihydroxyacetone kinase-like protein